MVVPLKERSIRVACEWTLVAVMLYFRAVIVVGCEIIGYKKTELSSDSWGNCYIS